MAKRTGLIFALLSGGAVLLLSRKAKSMGDVYLSRHFRLAEFLKSKDAPSLSNHSLSIYERANLEYLIKNVLEPAREEFGPLLVTSGGRPDTVLTPEGTTITEALRARGYEASETSDHKVFAAADIVPLRQGPEGWIRLYESLKKNPYVTQVILAWKTKNGERWPSYIHVGTKRIPSNKTDFAFMKLDGKRVADASYI